MSESPNNRSNGNNAGAGSSREAGQTTLSAIGDVSMAATGALGSATAASWKLRGLAILGFVIFTYLISTLAVLLTWKSAPWVRAFIVPLCPMLIAALVFWRVQVWKARSREWQRKEHARHDDLNSLLHVTANGLNAIRANLMGFREAAAEPSPHLEQVESALARIDAAVGKSLQAKPH